MLISSSSQSEAFANPHNPRHVVRLWKLVIPPPSIPSENYHDWTKFNGIISSRNSSNRLPLFTAYINNTKRESEPEPLMIPKLWEGPSCLLNSQVICSPLTVCVLMTSLLFVVISGNSMTYLPGSRAKWTRQASLKIMIIDSRGEIGIVLKFTSTDPHLITLLRGSPYQKRDKNTQQITLALYISKHNTLWKARSSLA